MNGKKLKSKRLLKTVFMFVPFSKKNRLNLPWKFNHNSLCLITILPKLSFNFKGYRFH